MPWSDTTLLGKLKDIPEKHAELYEAYRTFLLDNNSSPRNARNNLTVLILFSRFIGKKDLHNLERKDIIDFLDSRKKTIQEDPEQKWIITWNDYMSRLKGFFRWLYNKDNGTDRENWQTPPFIQIMSKKNKRISRYCPSDVWTADDIQRVVKYCSNTRDKALLTCSFDLASRNHELTKLRIKDIVFQENYAEAMIHWDTKTGMRPVPLIICFPYLKEWLNEHPFNNIQDFVVFPSLTRWKPLSPDSVWTITNSLKMRIKKLLEEGRIADEDEQGKLKELLAKPWNPYLLARHSSITEKASLLTDFQLKKFAGWSNKSKRSADYVHLSGKEILKPLLRHYGIEKETNESKLERNTCVKCRFVNTLHSKLCEQCGYVLGVLGYEEIKVKEQEILRRLTNLEEENQLMKMELARIEKSKPLLQQ